MVSSAEELRPIGGIPLDVFIEKIIKRKKTPFDYIATAVLIIAGVALIIGLSAVQYVQDFIIIITAGVIFGLYMFVKYNSVEFEYAVLNGDLDIDKILGMSRRKRLFSVSCREFEVFAPLESPQHAGKAVSIPNRLYVVTSMKDAGIYFFVASYEGKKTIVYFQPDERMLQNFALYNPNIMRDIKI